jgi:diguanylate cyclase (GGDEF)-like protein
MSEKRLLVLDGEVEQALVADELRRENARLRDSLTAYRECDQLARSLEPGTAFCEGLDLLLRTTGRSRGLAHFRRVAVPGGEGLIFRGFARTEAKRLRSTLGTTEPLGYGSSGQPQVVAESPLHGLLAELAVPEPGSALVVPLVGSERESGLMYVFDGGTPFSAEELERAAIVGQQGRIALENAERYQGAKTRALIDDLTGLHNAAYFLDAADHELERAARYGLQLSVLFLDIDRFKRVNDAHGHLIGSATLRHVATHLRDCVRPIDTLVRYGGDEFTILLTDTSPEAAMTAAERIRNAVAAALYREGDGNEVSVTVSIGVACYPHDSRQRDELVDLADKAMYRAKSIGRDRVALASELDPG